MPKCICTGINIWLLSHYIQVTQKTGQQLKADFKIMSSQGHVLWGFFVCLFFFVWNQELRRLSYWPGSPMWGAHWTSEHSSAQRAFTSSKSSLPYTLQHYHCSFTNTQLIIIIFLNKQKKTNDNHPLVKMNLHNKEIEPLSNAQQFMSLHYSTKIPKIVEVPICLFLVDD